MSEDVRIEGLREFNRAVRKASNETAKQLRREMKRRVAEPAAQRVRANVPVDSKRWQRAIRPGATQRGAHITWGRASVPYAPWIEFGGRRRHGPGGAAVATRTRVAEGRYVYPEVGRARGDAIEEAQRVLEEAFQRARLELRSGDG